MAHFALLNEKNIVEQVVVVDDNNCGGGVFPDSDKPGNDFLNSIGLTGNWKQTSYNSNFRRSFAGIGMFYSEEKDVFYAPSPYPSWTLDDECVWQPPIPMPETGGPWEWNEEEQEWQELS